MYVRMSCAIPAEEATPEFIQKLEAIAGPPIITTKVVRMVYEGENVGLATRVVALYETQAHPSIYYDDGSEQTPSKKKKKRH